MEKIITVKRLCAVLCILALCLASCAPARELHDYRSSGFECDAEFCVSELLIRAHIKVDPPQESAGGRGVSLELTYPAALSGITLRRHGTELTAECGGEQMSAELLSELFSWAELTLPQGELEYVCDTTLYGKEMIFAQIKDVEGEEVYELYLDTEDAIPVRICAKDREIRITSFEFLP